MMFSFLKYLQPTHYFQLLRKDGSSVFPIVNELPEGINSQLEKDVRFESPFATEYDSSWQAIQKGYIGHNTATYSSFQKL